MYLVALRIFFIDSINMRLSRDEHELRVSKRKTNTKDIYFHKNFRNLRRSTNFLSYWINIWFFFSSNELYVSHFLAFLWRKQRPKTYILSLIVHLTSWRLTYVRTYDHFHSFSLLQNFYDLKIFSFLLHIISSFLYDVQLLKRQRNIVFSEHKTALVSGLKNVA